MAIIDDLNQQELDAELRETAFQHWVLTCNRDEQRVAKKIGCSVEEITRWRDEEQWPIKARGLIAATTEDERFKILTNITYGADEAVQYLRDVVNGTVAEPSRERISAARELAYMAGYAPNTNNRPIDPQKPGKALKAEAIQQMTDAEIVALEAAIQDRHAEQNKEAFDRATRRK